MSASGRKHFLLSVLGACIAGTLTLLLILGFYKLLGNENMNVPWWTGRLTLEVCGIAESESLGCRSSVVASDGTRITEVAFSPSDDESVPVSACGENDLQSSNPTGRWCEFRDSNNRRWEVKDPEPDKSASS